MKKICVYCGSNAGRDSDYTRAAQALAAEIVARGQTLVYGGGNVGLMGVIANTVLAGGGRVIGVIPHQLASLELAHDCLTELHVVADMHERKAMMADLADGVIAMPGGMGTMEELFEALTWTQLGIHSSPCGLLNINGYYDHLLAFLNTTVEEHFVRPRHRDMLAVSDDPGHLLDQLMATVIPVDPKWVTGVDPASMQTS